MKIENKDHSEDGFLILAQKRVESTAVACAVSTRTIRTGQKTE